MKCNSQINVSKRIQAVIVVMETGKGKPSEACYPTDNSRNNMKKVRAMYSLLGHWGETDPSHNPVVKGADVSAGDGL